MKKFTTLLLSIVLLSCQKTIETQEQFLTRTNRANIVLRMQDADKLAVTVDFYKNPEAVTAYINRYDSVNGQPVLVDQDVFHIPATQIEYTRHLRPTGFPYRGNLQVRIQRDSTGAMPYERWVTLTNADGLVINYDTAQQAVTGWVGHSHVMDVVPKHYQ